MKRALLFLLLASQLFSAPALDRMRKFTNSDGSTFMAKGQGNQHLNWIKTEDGEILKYSKENKSFEYAVIEENALRASGVKYKRNDSKRARSLGRVERVKEVDLFKLYQSKQAEFHKRKVESSR